MPCSHQRTHRALFSCKISPFKTPDSNNKSHLAFIECLCNSTFCKVKPGPQEYNLKINSPSLKNFIFLFLATQLLSGCVSSQAKYEKAATLSRQAGEECNKAYERQELKSRLEKAKCINPKVTEAWQAAGYPFMDLIHLMNAKRAYLSEQRDIGGLTEAEADLIWAEQVQQMQREEQRRFLELRQAGVPQGNAGERLLQGFADGMRNPQNYGKCQTHTIYDSGRIKTCTICPNTTSCY